MKPRRMDPIKKHRSRPLAPCLQAAVFMLLTCILLSLMTTTVLAGSSSPYLEESESKPIHLGRSWEVFWGDHPGPADEKRWEPFDEAAQSRLTSYEGMLWLRRELPELRYRDPFLFLYGMKYAEVYVDRQLTYEFNMKQQNMYVNSFSLFHPMQLKKEYTGKLLQLRLKWNRGPLLPNWNSVMSRDAMVLHFVKQDTSLLVYAVLCILPGLVALGLFLRRRQERLYAWFSLLCLSAGFGFLSLMTSWQFFGDFGAAYYWRDVLLPLGILAFIGFYGEALGNTFGRIYRWLISSFAAYTLLSAVVGVISDRWYFAMLSYGLPYLFVPVLLTVAYTLIRFGAQSKWNQDVRWLTVGFVVLLVSASGHLTKNYITDSLRDLDGSLFVFYLFTQDLLPRGFIVFLFCLAVMMFRRFSDIHKRLAQYAEELAVKNAALAQFDKLKDDFLRNTSHELRTPLHGIAGLAESLLADDTGALSARTRESLRMIHHSSDRLLRLVGEILDFNRLKHKDVELKLAPVDAAHAANVVMTMLKPLADKKGLSTELSIRPGCPLIVADEGRLEQVLYNLIGNAIKYTEHGSVKVMIRELPEQRYVEFIVADTGEGITPDKAELLFEPFSSSDGMRGTGLGLSISKRLIELHSGTLIVKPNEAAPSGTQVIFTLPVTELPAGASPTPAASILEASHDWSEHVNAPLAYSDGNTHQQLPVVLIVDDEPVNVQVLYNFLGNGSLLLKSCQDGVEALALLESSMSPPALVLLDVMMPRMNGYEVCRRIRERWNASELPIIMLSARSTVEDLTLGFEAGANDYIPKPFSRGELLARVQTHLELSRFHHLLEALVDQRTAELKETSEALVGSIREAAEAMVEVSVLEERSRIAHEMHDVVGHTLTAAVVQLEAVKKIAERDIGLSLQQINDVQSLVRKGLDDIRRSVRLLADDAQAFDLQQAVNELLAETTEHTGVIIETDIDLPPMSMSSLMQQVLYHALMEGITNGIRHGECRRFLLRIHADGRELHFSLANDGRAYTSAKLGFGLSTMMERVHLLGGTVSIGPFSGRRTERELSGDSKRSYTCELAICLPLQHDVSAQEE
ncbi:ATP-binding protein [Paenibacillus sp. YYML68]|uniref:ATP-binding protein n=1 Tax=Paenibacillus sp. YYML68 TaxID=2909250 RepID=UPI002490F220|nr:ATP-binding protein [Paenibacillus sp. YYML68]